MLGKKRSREEEGLIVDESVTQYQNRCLFSHLKSLKEELSSSTSKLEAAKSQNSYLSKIFMEINCRLLNISEIVSLLKDEIPGEANEAKSNKNFVNWAISLLSDLKEGFPNRDKIFEENASMMDNIKDNIENIVTKMSSGESEKKESEVDSALKVKLGNLKEILSEIKTKISHKMDIDNYEEVMKEKDDIIENLKKENMALNRRVICFPAVPYIKYSKEFDSEIEKTEHKCWCYLCNKEFTDAAEKKDESLVSSAKLSIPVGGNQDSSASNERCSGNCGKNNCGLNSNFQPNVIIVNNQSSSNIFPGAFPNSKESKIAEELEMVQSKLTEIIGELDDYKKQSEFNEINILESKSFKTLVDHAESNMNILSQMKEYYIKLYKKHLELVKDIDLERKRFEEKEYKIQEDYKRKYYDAKDEILRLKSDIRNLKCTISDLEVSKNDSLNFESIYEFYEKEKSRVYSEINKLTLLLSESRENHSKEFESNNKLIDEISKLKEENELLKKDKSEEKSSEDPKMQKLVEEELKKSIRSKKEKIYSLEKKIQKLSEELLGEKDLNNTLIQEMESNELGINEMNAQIKKLKDQLVIENEKIAKLTQDKIKNQKNIENLIHERETVNDIISEYKNQLEISKGIETHYKEEIESLKRINEKLEDAIQENENSINALNNQVESLNKNNHELKSITEQQENLLKEYREENKTLKSNVERMNAIISGKKLQKEKEIESKILNKDEFDHIKRESDTLKQLVKCMVCNTNYKNCIISKCYHTFCRECINKNLSARQRMCPFCKEKFQDSDIKNFYLNY